MSDYCTITSPLGQWLSEYREPVLAQWRCALDGNLHQMGQGEALIHPDEQHVLLCSIYDGMVAAAAGDPQPLEQCLRLMRAFRSSRSEDELPEWLATIFGLRQVVRDLLRVKRTAAPTRQALLDELEQFTDQMALQLARHWTEAANIVSQQLQQTESLIASLNEAHDEADRLVLQVSQLNEMAHILASSLDADDLLGAVGEKLVEVLGVTHISVWLASGEHALRLANRWGAPELPIGLILQDNQDTDLVLQAYAQGTELMEATPAPPQQGEWYQPGCAVVAVPLLAQERSIGVVVLQDSDAEHRFDPSQRHFINSAVSQLAIALQNARLYDEVRGFNTVLEQRIAERTRELQTERDMLETLHQIALEVGSTLDIDVLLQNCLNLLAGIMNVENGSVMLTDVETDQLVNRAALGRQVSGFTRFTIGQGVAGWVAQHRKPALIDDISQDPRWVELPTSDHPRKRSGSMIAVPLIVQHDVMGVLQLSHEQQAFFGEDHLRMLSAAGGEIALGIHNALLYEQIQQQLMRQGDMLRNERRATTQSTAILHSLSDGVIVCDTEGVVITANPAVERILERSIEELVVWNIVDLFTKLLGSQSLHIPFADLMNHPLDEHGAPRSFSTKLQIGVRMVRLTIDPVLLSADDVMGAVAVLRDITREVESERMKDEFIGTVSHELRTPMASIKGYTQLLSMGSLGPINDSQRSFLQTIATNADRMITIINDVLDITKIETGSIELDLRPLHIAETLGSVVLGLQPMLQDRQHELVINIPPGLSSVKADGRRLDQVLTNLLSNAIKYTPRGGKVTVDVRDVTTDDLPEEQRAGLRPGRYVRVDVTDTGIGICADEQALIFQRFYRTENPLKVEAGGTGLGLSLVRPLVRLFGGRIWVASVPDKGSTFSFVLPAA